MALKKLNWKTNFRDYTRTCILVLRAQVTV